MRAVAVRSYRWAAAVGALLAAGTNVACSDDGGGPSGSAASNSGGGSNAGAGTGGAGAPSTGGTGAASGGSGGSSGTSGGAAGAAATSGSGGAAGSGGLAGAAGADDCLGDLATMAPSNCADLVYYTVDCGSGARPLGSEHCDYLKIHTRRQVFEAIFTCLSNLDLELPFCAGEHDAAVRACENAAFEAACATTPAAGQMCPEQAACPALSAARCRTGLDSLNETTRADVVSCYGDELPMQVEPSLTCDAKFEECFWNIDAYVN